jgi:hypothetical protein
LEWLNFVVVVVVLRFALLLSSVMQMKRLMQMISVLQKSLEVLFAYKTQ